MIDGVLVKTFLGVFMAYCFVKPFANKIFAYHYKDEQFYKMIKDIMVAHFKNNSPPVSVEVNRTDIPSLLQPSFFKLRAALKEIKLP